MVRTLAILTAAVLLLSCTHTQTRSERMESSAEEYLERTTPNLAGYVIVGRNLESSETVFYGFVGYRCVIGGQYSIYKTIFVGVHGDTIVYVGTNEESAQRITNAKKSI